MNNKKTFLVRVISLFFIVVNLSTDKDENFENHEISAAENFDTDNRAEDSDSKKEETKKISDINFPKESRKMVEKFYEFMMSLLLNLNEEKYSNEQIMNIFRENDIFLGISSSSIYKILGKIGDDTASFSFSEVRSVLVYFISLMSFFDKKIDSSVSLQSAKEVSNELVLLDLCNNFFVSYDHIFDNSSIMSEFELKKLKEEYLTMISATIVLVRNIIKNIKTGNYNKKNIIYDIFSKEKTISLDKESGRYIFQNSFLLPQFEAINEELQGYLVMLEDFEKGYISQKRLIVVHNELIKKIINFLGLVDHCIASNYSPMNKKFTIAIKANENPILHDIKNKIFTKEIEVTKSKIEDFVKNTYKKIDNKKKHHSKKLTDQLLIDINFCEDAIRKYNNKNAKLAFYYLQNFYRETVYSLQKLNRLNVFTKAISNFLLSSNFVLTVFGWEIYAYFKSINFRLGFGDAITNLGVQLQSFFRHGRFSDEQFNEHRMRSYDSEFEKILNTDEVSLIIEEFNKKVIDLKSYNSDFAKDYFQIHRIDIPRGIICDIQGNERNIKDILKEFTDKKQIGNIYFDLHEQMTQISENNNIYENQLKDYARTYRKKKKEINDTYCDNLEVILKKSNLSEEVRTEVKPALYYASKYITNGHFSSWNKFFWSKFFTTDWWKSIWSSKQPYNYTASNTGQLWKTAIKDPQCKFLSLDNMSPEVRDRLLEEEINKSYAIEKLYIEYGPVLASAKSAVLRNKIYTGFQQVVDFFPGGTLALTGGLTYGLHKGLNTVFKENTFASSIKHFFYGIHFYLMGKKQEIDDNFHGTGISAASQTGITLEDECFSYLDKQGTLDWLKSVLRIVKDAVNGDPLDMSMLSRIPYSCFLSGPSGCGKTYLVNAFANSLQNIIKSVPKERTQVEAEFLVIDPKYFDGFIKDGEVKKVDIIEELIQLLKESLVKNTFYVVYFDEFHLFFSKDGRPNQSRIADLLKFFNDLYTKQRDHKGLGGMYVICSTNKPEFIPHEFFDNGARLGGIYNLQYGDVYWIKEVMERELNKIGAITSYIDWEYLKSVLRGYSLTHSNVLEIINKSFAYAQFNNKIIDTNVIYHFINEVVRKIIVSKKENANNIFDNGLLEALSSYYGSLVAAAINFSLEDNDLFDMATVFPLKKDFEPQHTDRTYLRPLNKKTKYGGIFYLNNRTTQFFDKKSIAYEIVKRVAGVVYLDMNQLHKFDVIDSLAEVEEILYYYFATKVSNADLAKRIQLATKISENGRTLSFPRYDDLYSKEIVDKIKNILIAIERYIVNFYSVDSVKEVISNVQGQLFKNKMITLKEVDKLLSSELRRETQAAFDILINNVISIL